MNHFIIPAAFVIAFILTLIFAVLFPGRPFWRGLLLFFLLIFLVGWSAQLWISPIGPVVWGISWFPLLFVSVVFSLLIIAAIATEKEPAEVSKSPEAPVKHRGLFVIGFFFWLLLILLISSIIIGYYLVPIKPVNYILP